MESLSKFELFFCILPGLMEVKVVLQLMLAVTALKSPGIVVGERPWTRLTEPIIEPGFVDERVVDCFKRTIALWAFIIVDQDFWIHEAVTTCEDDHAADMVAGFVGVADAAIDGLEGHLGRYWQVNIIKARRF